MRNVFNTVQSRYNLNMGDFPPLEEFQETLRGMDIKMLAGMKLAVIDELDLILDRDVPRLMESLPGMAEGADDAEGAGHLIAALSSGLRVIKHGESWSVQKILLSVPASFFENICFGRS